ncbi:hypothetical protein CR513_59128, partial [Mucuna pruriens]
MKLECINFQKKKKNSNNLTEPSNGIITQSMCDSSPAIGTMCNRVVIIGTPPQPLVVQHASMGIIGPNTAIIDRHSNRSPTVTCLQTPNAVN